ncbi:protein SPO16 homolog isoform X1 [Chiloscyllium plagiosum]|uniref:protein SPO16 homolog isoform X1 n=1 Tax=Chiloscyllium plagiosum TaxID=36176 RepID=UPI001CB81574|nr:protein SPO16 homolog isoform X1 [Chiloscyllium plagiosum]
MIGAEASLHLQHWGTHGTVQSPTNNKQVSDIKLCCESAYQPSTLMKSYLDSKRIAYIIMEIEDFCDNSREIKLMEQIEQFVHIHRNSFLLLAAALYGAKEWEILFKIQQRFLGSNLKIIPAHNSGDMVKSMLTIAKVTCKPHVDSVRDRIAMIRAQIIEHSPVWEMLHKQQLNDAK